MAFTINIQSPTRNQIFTDIQALIFDKDGTLENSKVYLENLTIERLRLLEEIAAGISQPLARAFGFDGQRLSGTGLMGVGSRQETLIASAAYVAERGHSWFDALTLSHHCFDQADRQVIPNAQTCPMFPGVGEQLQIWSQRGVKIAILSAARQWSVERFIADHQLESWVEFGLGSDQGLSKPDPALYQLACQKLGVDPQQTLMIGDAQGDITMAKRAGAKGAIAIGWPGYQSVQLKQADCTIEAIEQIQIVG
jgi:phosphoglycolate phosphatase